MRTLLFICLMCVALPSLSEEEKFWEGCTYILGVSRFAYRMAHHEGVPEHSYHIADDERYPEERKMYRDIVHDVYHDLKSLRERVEKACAEKESS